MVKPEAWKVRCSSRRAKEEAREGVYREKLKVLDQLTEPCVTFRFLLNIGEVLQALVDLLAMSTTVSVKIWMTSTSFFLHTLVCEPIYTFMNQIYFFLNHVSPAKDEPYIFFFKSIFQCQRLSLFSSIVWSYYKVDRCMKDQSGSFIESHKLNLWCLWSAVTKGGSKPHFKALGFKLQLHIMNSYGYFWICILPNPKSVN